MKPSGLYAVPQLTSLDPDVLAELGGHAHQECLAVGCDCFVEVVTTTPCNLEVNTGETGM